jgi:hypothetical protein
LPHGAAIAEKALALAERVLGRYEEAEPLISARSRPMSGSWARMSKEVM